MADLAQASNVSLGHVSNVKNALIDNEWAEVTDDGLRLTNLDYLLTPGAQLTKGRKGVA